MYNCIYYTLSYSQVNSEHIELCRFSHFTMLLDSSSFTPVLGRCILLPTIVRCTAVVGVKIIYGYRRYTSDGYLYIIYWYIYIYTSEKDKNWKTGHRVVMSYTKTGDGVSLIYQIVGNKCDLRSVNVRTDRVNSSLPAYAQKFYFFRPLL